MDFYISRSLFLHCCWLLVLVLVQSVKKASHFVKIIVACPHHLPKLPKLPE
jgi:hypothetical protein